MPGARRGRKAQMYWADDKKKNQMSFGGDYRKDTGSYVSAVKDAIAAMVAALPEITIKRACVVYWYSIQ